MRCVVVPWRHHAGKGTEMFALSRIIIVLGTGLGVSIVLRERFPRLLWWLVGAQLLAVVAGCAILYLADAGGSAGASVRASTRILICVFGPATVLSSLVAAWTIDKLNKRRALDDDIH